MFVDRQNVCVELWPCDSEFEVQHLTGNSLFFQAQATRTHPPQPEIMLTLLSHSRSLSLSLSLSCLCSCKRFSLISRYQRLTTAIIDLKQMKAITKRHLSQRESLSEPEREKESSGNKLTQEQLLNRNVETFPLRSFVAMLHKGGQRGNNPHDT